MITNTLAVMGRFFLLFFSNKVLKPSHRSAYNLVVVSSYTKRYTISISILGASVIVPLASASVYPVFVYIHVWYCLCHSVQAPGVKLLCCTYNCQWSQHPKFLHIFLLLSHLSAVYCCSGMLESFSVLCIPYPTLPYPLLLHLLQWCMSVPHHLRCSEDVKPHLFEQ